MPIVPPRLDDRGFDDLVEELIARIPAHTPEWVPLPGDPGRTLLELFAWLGDTILYRANLIPERQRLAFLKLLGRPLRPAQAARGIVSVKIDEPDATDAITIGPFASLPGPVNFESRTELTILPVTGECFYKRRLREPEAQELSELLDELGEFHDLNGRPLGYVTTPAFGDGPPNKTGIDIIDDAVDRSLWVALFAAAPHLVDDVKEALAGTRDRRQQLLNIGIAPAIELPGSFDDAHVPGRIAHVWEISTADHVNGKPVYSMLARLNGADTTNDLTRRGVERLILPGDPDDFGVLEGDVRIDSNAGVGDRPPRLDDPDKIRRVVAWLRLRPTKRVERMALSWVGVNALEIDQRQTVTGRVIGQSDGSADQMFQLTAQSVDPETFKLQVEEPERGYIEWQRVDDLATTGRDDAVFHLDSEAGTVSFGNGVFGRIPEPGRRVRVAMMRSGGGIDGNLASETLTQIKARDLNGNVVTRKIKADQPLATEGGDDAETLAEADKRIPGWLRNRNRSVTEADYRELAVETPGVRIARVEVLPRFMPRQRRSGVPGVVSVMVLPYKELPEPPNPRADQPMIERVFEYLDKRRPLATELYVIGCEYIPVGLSVGMTVKDGFNHDTTVHGVREALKRYLWPLPPDGPQGQGWPLGKTVNDRELAVIVAGVEGVNTVSRINVFTRENKLWRMLSRAQTCDEVELTLQSWQLPELMNVVVSVDGDAAEELATGAPDPYAGEQGAEGGGEVEEAGGFVAVPVVPEEC